MLFNHSAIVGSALLTLAPTLPQRRVWQIDPIERFNLFRASKVFERRKIRGSVDFEALKLWNVRSGSERGRVFFEYV